jgi:hypothetical protein
MSKNHQSSSVAATHFVKTTELRAILKSFGSTSKKNTPPLINLNYPVSSFSNLTRHNKGALWNDFSYHLSPWGLSF